MKKLLTILIFIFSIIIFAQNNTESFLDWNVSPIGEGTSGNIIASFYNSNFVYNPAIISKYSKIFIEYEHKFLMSSLSQYNSIFFFAPVYNNVGMGLGYINQIINDIPEYPEYNDSLMNADPQTFFAPISYFTDFANAFYFNISYFYNKDDYSKYNINVGINIKYIYHSIYDYTGTGTGIDIGIGIDSDLNRLMSSLKGKIRYSIVLEDVGNTNIVWDTPSSHNDERKMRIKTGLAYNLFINKINSDFNIEIDYKRIDDLSVFGQSLIYNFDNMLYIYYGFNIYKDIDITVNTPSFGAGVSVLNFDVHFGMSSNDLGYNYSIGIKYSL